MRVCEPPRSTRALPQRILGREMSELFDLARSNLLSPMVLFFALGVLAGRVKSDLHVPEAMSKGLALYLMFAIGFKGGLALFKGGAGGEVLAAAGAAIALSALLPLLAFAVLRAATGIPRPDAAAIAAHYGSVSVVTFVSATAFLTARGQAPEGYMVVMMALMETPAIITGLLLARGTGGGRRIAISPALLREVLASGSILLLVGSFAIGWITGEAGERAIGPVVVDPFQGALCFFLLDMGLLVARRLEGVRDFDLRLLLFGLYMPLIGAAAGLGAAALLGLSVGGAALLATLVASASYIVVPAAMRLAVPEANPGLYVTLSLAVTFPFNLVLGIPLYYRVAERLWG